jgi:hypothetical protein
MRPKNQESRSKKFRYVHPELRGYHRGYDRLLKWCLSAPRNHLIALSLTFRPELELAPRECAKRWTAFAKEFLRKISWLEGWARAFELGESHRLHIHATLRMDRPVFFIWKLKIGARHEIVKGPEFLARFYRELLKQRARFGIGGIHMRRTGNLKKWCVYLTAEQKARGEEKLSRPGALKGVRLYEFSRRERPSSENL